MSKKLLVPKLCGSSSHEFALYPDENHNGIVITEVEHLELHDIYLKIYPVIIKKIVKRYEKSLKCDLFIAEAIVASAVPSLLKVFFDISFRIKKAADSQNGNLSIAKIDITSELPADLDIGGIIQKIRTDFVLNTELIYLIGEIFDFTKVDVCLDCKNPPTHQNSFVNHNSRLYKRSILNGLFERAKKMFFTIRNSFFTAKIGILNESYMTSPMVKKGLYGRYFEKIGLDIDIDNSNYSNNVVLRGEIFKTEDFDNSEINFLLNKMSLNTKERVLFKSKLVKYLRKFYPIDSLEMLHDYITALDKKFDDIKVDNVLSGSGSDAKSIFFLSLARKRKIKIFRSQHGGYYGYYKTRYYYENYKWINEYSSCDYYLTWGWNESIQHNLFNTKCLPFMSPWLSERKNFWSKNLRITSKKYSFDVIIAPTKLSPFSSIAHINSVDEIALRSDDLVSIVQELTRVDLNVLYKSPSLLSNDGYQVSINKMKKIGKNKFYFMDRIDKGITLELLEQAPIILWDTLGTGFLECIACGIPTVVYIHSYLSFTEQMKVILRKLESVGIVHTNEKSLACEILLYKNNMGKWFLDKKRKEYIEEFADLFCNTSEDWSDKLIAKISLLGSHDERKYGVRAPW